MTMKRFVFLFIGIGTLLPAVWFAIYYLSPGFRHWWYATPAWTDHLLLAFWPSSILLLADPKETSVLLPIVTTGLNAVLYGILGVLFWIGLKRSKAVLAVTLAALSLGWYGLLTL